MAENTPGFATCMTGCEGDGERRRETGSQGDNADISFEMQDTGRGVSHLAGHSICKPIKPGQPPGIGAAEMGSNK